jgi:hypothetical protein
MKPISKLNFGPGAGSMKISYHNGNSVVQGYVVKQVGSSRFVCGTANVSATSTVLLAPNTAVATSLVAGFGTITGSVYGSNVVEHVSTIHSATCTTTEGHSYSWNLGNATVTGHFGIKAN